MRRAAFLTIILTSLLLTQCSEDFLNLQPVSEIGEGDYYKTEEEIEVALVGCYNSLQGAVATEWMVTEFRADNSIYNPTFSTGRQPSMYALDVFTLTSENIYVDEYYTAVYQSLSTVNTVMTHMDVYVDEASRNHAEGQLRFIRAHNYFNLVRLFGPVFMVTEQINSTEANQMQRSPEDSVYQFIVDDLLFAAQHIDDERYTQEDAGRVTSWAAKALLAKVYLTMHTPDDLGLARDLLEDIITNSGHSLLPDFEDVFDDNNEMNNEIIFAVRFKTNTGGLGNPLTTMFAPNNVKDIIVTGTGNGYNYPATELVDTYKSTDTRRTTTVLTSYIDDNGKQVFINYPGKFISNQQVSSDSEADWPVIRFSDVLLMYAEVLNELEGPASGLPYLNLVHERAGLSPVTSDAVDTKHNFRLTLENERKLEFAFENHRWFDLVRTGRVYEVMKNHFKTALEYSLITGVVVPDELEAWQLLLPIPQSQIDINPAFSQNYGY